MCPRAVVLNLLVSCFALAQSYTISTFAGGAPRPTPSAQGSIGTPAGVGVDAAGKVYFASLNCIFRLDSKGALTRIAGNYSAGFSGDGGPATAAQLNFAPPLDYGPVINMGLGLAVDTQGNVYFPDGNRIRKISTSGIITTFAGGGNSDPLLFPNHLAFGADGSLYITDSHGVEKVFPDGTITTVNSSHPYAGIAVDSTGNLYLADTLGNAIRQLSPAGTLTTIAGTGADYPTDLALDAAGNLYYADTLHFHIRKVSPDGSITTIAGTGVTGYSGDGGAAVEASVAPRGLANDAAGNLDVADAGSNRIRRISPTGIIASLAGDGTQAYSGDGGLATSAQLSSPCGLATDNAGNIYIADCGNNRVRRVSTDGTIATIAGNGNPGHLGDGGPATAAELLAPSGLALDSSGDLYVHDTDRIRKVSPDGTMSTLSPGPFNTPIWTALAADTAGNVYIPEIGKIMKVSPQGTVTVEVCCWIDATGVAIDPAGNLNYSVPSGGLIGSLSPKGTVTLLTQHPGNGCAGYLGVPFAPLGIGFDSSGNLYSGDGPGARIRIVTPSGLVNTIAGTGTPGYSGDGGPATSAQVGYPFAVAVDPSGNIYFTDLYANVVRVLKPAPPAPVTVTAVLNAASLLSGPIASGEVVVLTGAGLGPSPLFQCQYDAAGALIDTSLEGTQVFFNGIPALVLYTSSTQVATFVPYAISGDTAQVTVTFQGRSSAALSVPIAPQAPGVFTTSANGEGQAIVTLLDIPPYLNSGAFPPRPGDTISLYATGEGQTSPAGVNGKLASSQPYPKPLLPMTVSIDGQTVTPLYAGADPGYLAGMMRIDIQIPTSVTPGPAVPLTIQVGTVSSQSGVTIAIGSYN